MDEVLLSPEKYLADVPEEDRWNLFITMGHPIEDDVRVYSRQEVLPIDIDDVKDDERERVVEAVCSALELPKEKVGSLCSGNGVQLFIKLEIPIEDEKFFRQNRVFYKAICQRINQKLRAEMLSGEADPSVFSPGRLMRMPGTTNKKKNKEPKKAFVIQPNIEPCEFSFGAASGIPTVDTVDQISPEAMKRFGDPDTQTVLKECLFVKHCGESPEKLSEPQWYAMLSIVGRLENGKELVHTYSSGHPGYSQEETDTKLEQAIATAGPRTCKNIESLWGGCQGCKHFGKIKTPIMIEGETHIKTKTNGFYYLTKTGRVPCYEDMLKYFKQKHPYYVEMMTKNVSTFSGKHWKEVGELYMKNFAEINFSPAPMERVRAEFLNKVRSNGVRTKEWERESTLRKINLQNGIYDIEKDVLLEHSPDYAFRAVLPYNYDAKATAPKFLKFMAEVTCGDKEVEKLLLEYLGYCISGDSYWLHKALVLFGEGRNGKSTMMNVLKAVVGDEFYSSLNLSALNDPAKRYMIVGKLFNFGEETHVSALSKSEVFKVLSSGGEVDIKRLYQQPFKYQSNVKLVFACNKLPYSYDKSEGLYRRLVIVPFNAKFEEGKNENKHMDLELFEELPGILNILVRHFRDLKKRGVLPMCKVVEDTLESYKYENDQFLQWFDDEVERTEDGFVASSEAYASYKNYCASNGYKDFSGSMDFFKNLTKQIGQENHVRRYVNNRRIRGYQGITIRGITF